MPKGSKVEQVEKKLKKEYPGKPGAVYGTLNKIGLMHGNKATAKGAEPAKVKSRKVTPASKPKKRSADFQEASASQAMGSSRKAGDSLSK